MIYCSQGTKKDKLKGEKYGYSGYLDKITNEKITIKKVYMLMMKEKNKFEKIL